VTEAFQFKVVVAGPFAAGKTTFIEAISQSAVVGTEAPTSGAESSVKATTTVGMEYGSFAVHDGDLSIELLLYGVPGQARFRFMWDIVAEGMDVLLLLVDATRPESWPEAVEVGTYLVDRHRPPVLVAVNRGAAVPGAIDAVAAAVPLPDARFVACDVTDPESARHALVVLLDLLLDELEADDEPEPAAFGDAPVDRVEP
jgi:signal recognition particle receptor subunit beta